MKQQEAELIEPRYLEGFQLPQNYVIDWKLQALAIDLMDFSDEHL